MVQNEDGSVTFHFAFGVRFALLRIFSLKVKKEEEVDSELEVRAAYIRYNKSECCIEFEDDSFCVTEDYDEFYGSLEEAKILD